MDAKTFFEWKRKAPFPNYTYVGLIICIGAVGNPFCPVESSDFGPPSETNLYYTFYSRVKIPEQPSSRVKHSGHFINLKIFMFRWVY